MKTTLSAIRAHGPCASGWRKLLAHLNKPEPDDEPLSLLTILESNGLDDALWALRAVEGYDREIRLYAVWCARRVEHLLTDRRSLDALEVAERFARGRATREELAAACDAAAAALDAARDAARAAAAAALDAAWAAAAACDAAAAARDAALDAARDAAWGAAWDAAAARDAAAAARDAALDAARDAARDAAWGAQIAELRRMCECIDAGVDPYPEEAL